MYVFPASFCAALATDCQRDPQRWCICLLYHYAIQLASPLHRTIQRDLSWRSRAAPAEP